MQAVNMPVTYVYVFGDSFPREIVKVVCSKNGAFVGGEFFEGFFNPFPFECVGSKKRFITICQGDNFFNRAFHGRAVVVCASDGFEL